jgi:hypothetical protein
MLEVIRERLYQNLMARSSYNYEFNVKDYGLREATELYHKEMDAALAFFLSCESNG